MEVAKRKWTIEEIEKHINLLKDKRENNPLVIDELIYNWKRVLIRLQNEKL